MTLYALTDELSQLLAVRAEMLEDKEDVAAIDTAIAEYMTALPKKADAVAHVLRSLETQAALSKLEEERLYERRKRFESCYECLEACVSRAMSKLPKPARGSRKIEGSVSTLMLKGNGGPAPLDVYDATLVPDEYCTFTLALTGAGFEKLTQLVDRDDFVFAADRAVDNTAVRKALEAPCWLCDGKGGDCSSCGGSGKQGVPGARLLERGAHLEIK